MKKITLLLFTIIISLFVIYCFPSAGAETPSPENDPQKHPLQIESLRASHPRGTDLKILNTLQNTKTLTNKLISYKVD